MKDLFPFETRWQPGQVIGFGVDTSVKVYIRNGTEAGGFSDDRFDPDILQRYRGVLLIVIKGTDLILGTKMPSEPVNYSDMLVVPLSERYQPDFSGAIFKIRQNGQDILHSCWHHAATQLCGFDKAKIDEALQHVEAAAIAEKQAARQALSESLGPLRVASFEVAERLPGERGDVIRREIRATTANIFASFCRLDGSRPMIELALPPHALNS